MRFVLVVVIAALFVPVAAAAKPRPALTLEQLSPARVQGSQFKAGRKVHVTLTVGGTRLRQTVHVSMQGTFTARFGRLAAVKPCGRTVTIVAVGAEGERSTLRVPVASCASVAPTATSSTPGLAPSPASTNDL